MPKLGRVAGTGVCAPVADALGRPIKDLRISLTDRCNSRCTYCMPLDEYAWMNHDEILTFEEIVRLARLFIGLGVDRIRLTGGEPLLRRNLASLVARLASLEGLNDLSLTTNGLLLARQISALASAGLKRINVSIDSLDPDCYHRITKRDALPSVLEGLFAAKKAGLRPIKINAVVIRGVNDCAVLPLVEFARTHDFAVRFIEYTDAGNANGWTASQLVSKREILELVHSRYPLREIGRARDRAPSVDYEYADGRGSMGVIATITEPFCHTCTRGRLTADGRLVTCLFSDRGYDVKSLMRNGASDEAIAQFLRNTWSRRSDRFSEERRSAIQSPDGYCAGDRRKMEMISLGG